MASGDVVFQKRSASVGYTVDGELQVPLPAGSAGTPQSYPYGSAQWLTQLSQQETDSVSDPNAPGGTAEQTTYMVVLVQINVQPVQGPGVSYNPWTGSPFDPMKTYDITITEH